MAPNGKNGSISAPKYLEMAGSVMASEPNDTNGDKMDATASRGYRRRHGDRYGHQPLDGASVI